MAKEEEEEEKKEDRRGVFVVVRDGSQAFVEKAEAAASRCPLRLLFEENRDSEIMVAAQRKALLVGCR
jgi:hypothetical protein